MYAGDKKQLETYFNQQKQNYTQLPHPLPKTWKNVVVEF